MDLGLLIVGSLAINHVRYSCIPVHSHDPSALSFIPVHYHDPSALMHPCALSCNAHPWSQCTREASQWHQYKGNDPKVRKERTQTWANLHILEHTGRVVSQTSATLSSLHPVLFCRLNCTSVISALGSGECIYVHWIIGVHFSALECMYVLPSLWKVLLKQFNALASWEFTGIFCAL